MADNENKQTEAAPEAQKLPYETDANGNPVHKNWVTDLYDKMNVKIWQMDVAIILLGALIIGIAIFAK